MHIDSIFAAMVFRFSPETLVSSLLMMAKGMLGIFAVIVVIWLFVLLLGKAAKPKEKEDPAK